jgi:hypothetical protein
MSIVSSLSLEELNLQKKLKDDKNANMQRCLKYLEFAGIKNPENLLPDRSKHVVLFEMKCCSELANAVRRVINGEIETYSLDMDYKDLDTDDSYILEEVVKEQIELLPLDQDIEDKDQSFYLDVSNETDKIMGVYSDSIRCMNEKYNLYIPSKIRLLDLRPGCYIKIKDIKVVKGLGIHDNGKFSLVSNVSYKILDKMPYDENNHNPDDSSLNSTPGHFRISYTTRRNIREPRNIMMMCCDNLKDRLNDIKKELNRVDPSSKQHFSNDVSIITSNNIREITLSKESWTVLNLLCKYCYLEDSNIGFLTGKSIQTDGIGCVLKIRHSEYLRLIKNAIDRIIIDIDNIKKAFKK